MFRATRSLAVAALLLVVGCNRPPADGGTEPLDDLGPVGAFKLTERNGKPMTDADLRGKVWVASFVFTRCTGPCPQVTATFARLQKELDLAGEPDLRLVTFTVDPERDQPRELTLYAESYQAHPDRWLFLTGDKDTLYALLREGFKVAVAEKRESEKKPGDEFSHSTKLVLVDKQGHIRGYFDGMPATVAPEDVRDFDDNRAKLKRAVRALLAEEP